jgi:hypothetical protein
LGLEQAAFDEYVANNNYEELGKHLYRTQKMGSYGSGKINIWFRHVYETQLIDDNNSKKLKRFYVLQSIKSFMALNPIKVKVNTLGELLL